MGVAWCGGCVVEKLRCEGVAVCGSFGVWELQRVGVEGYGKSVWELWGVGGCCVGGLRCGRVAVWVDFL